MIRTTINNLQACALAILIVLVVCSHSALKTTGYSATITFGHEQMLASELGSACIPTRKIACAKMPMKEQAITIAALVKK